MDLLGIPVPDTFVGVPARCDYSDVLLQNGQRVSGLTDGELQIDQAPVDMGTLTRLGIYRPSSLLP